VAALLAVEQVRAALGDIADEPAWTNAEIATRLDQASGAVAATVYRCLLELQAEAAGRYNYTVGSSINSVGDIFKQLDTLVDRWHDEMQRETVLLQRAIGGGSLPSTVPVEVWF
jgi:maltooligosyltrehalose synthase